MSPPQETVPLSKGNKHTVGEGRCCFATFPGPSGRFGDHKAGEGTKEDGKTAGQILGPSHSQAYTHGMAHYIEMRAPSAIISSSMDLRVVVHMASPSWLCSIWSCSTEDICRFCMCGHVDMSIWVVPKFVVILTMAYIVCISIEIHTEASMRQ